ncbi:MAG: LysM peptidoglycan-binding domain-containing protein [Bacteroidota bacterium]
MRALALVALIAAPAASAQVASNLADLRLATAVRLALVADVRTRAYDVDVTARRGAVDVAGDLTPVQRRLLGEVVRDVPGVRSLDGAAVGDGPIEGPVVTVVDRVPPEAAGATAPRPEAGPTYHRVRRGDTLFSLARRYDTTVEAIRELNGLRSTSIRLGQRLRVR